MAARIPTRKLPATQEIAAFLSAEIRSGALPPGARLPTELALAQRFGVSRPVVREAIARVKADGLVQSRQGSGLYVADPRGRPSFRIDENPGQDFSVALKLFELRGPIEAAAARLAAARRSDADLARMEAAQAGFKGAVAGSDAEVAADLAFHHAIAASTQNGYYADFTAYLAGVLQSGMRVARAWSGADVRRRAIDEHDRIVRAIRDRDPEIAALAALTHLNNARERMEAGRLSPDAA